MYFHSFIRLKNRSNEKFLSSKHHWINHQQLNQSFRKLQSNVLKISFHKEIQMHDANMQSDLALITISKWNIFSCSTFFPHLISSCLHLMYYDYRRFGKGRKNGRIQSAWIHIFIPICISICCSMKSENVHLIFYIGWASSCILWFRLGIMCVCMYVLIWVQGRREKSFSSSLR